MDKISEAIISHALPTRLRIKIPSRKRDAAYFAAVAESLSGCPGVLGIETNSGIGSILVHYSGDVKTLAAFARAKDLFLIKVRKRQRRSVMGDMAATFRTYDNQLMKMTGGELDIGSLVFLSLVISGVYQILRGNLTTPAWYTAFYFALGVFTHSHTRSYAIDEYDEGKNLLWELDEESPGEFEPGDME